jgi:hypothetical protein
MPLLRIATSDPTEPHPTDRELLLLAVEGARLAAEEASRAHQQAAEARAILGTRPGIHELERVAAEPTTAAQMAEWESRHGLVGQVALMGAHMRRSARLHRVALALLALASVAAEALPDIIRAVWLGGAP